GAEAAAAAATRTRSHFFMGFSLRSQSMVMRRVGRVAARGGADRGWLRHGSAWSTSMFFLKARLPTARALPLERGTSARPAWQLGCQANAAARRRGRGQRRAPASRGTRARDPEAGLPPLDACVGDHLSPLVELSLDGLAELLGRARECLEA